MRENNPAFIALKDIKDSLKKESDRPLITQTYYGKEVWFVFGSNLYTKENRRLNKKMGLWGVNKQDIAKNLRP